jgi:acetolactate synthase-1/2/3 large subunit
MTSPKAKGIVPESGTYCLGVFGHGGHPSAFDWLRDHPPDVVLALGCGLGETSTNSWSPMLQATQTMIQVEVDASRFGRNYRVDLAIEGDCADVVPLFRAELGDCPPFAAQIGGITYLDSDAMHTDRTPLAPARVLTVLQECMPSDTVYTSDIGEHLFFALHYLRVSLPDQFIAALGVASMGSGIGSAIGAKIAAPERPVVAICGDYGFQMYGMELSTCVQEGVAVVFLIMNDSRMRMVESGLARIYGRSLSMSGPLVNFAAIARAHGARGIEIDDAHQLALALQNLSPDGPTVLDVRIDPRAVFPVNARVTDISHFTSEARKAP